MGFWDSVKKAANSAKCMAGFHAGDYRQVENKPECNMEMVCSDCNKHLTKIEHKFGKSEYLKENKCDTVCSCEFCGEEKKSIKHNWTQSKNNCKVEKNCERCGANEFVRTEHGRWYAGVAHPDGMQTFSCSDCGKTEERKFDPTAR